MASDPRESQGPDRCRGSIRCMEFHDPTVGDLGGHYNCCCCEPCLYVRPFMSVRDQTEHEWNACCNCAPRLLYARFVPDDVNDGCCVTAGVPMFHGVAEKTANKAAHRSVYLGTLFGISIRVELGQICDEYGAYSAYSEDCDCGWKIILERSGHAFLPNVDYSSTVLVDHDAVTCLAVPDISISVIGPDECSGKLSLENIPIAKLPYLEREEVVEFASHRPPEYDYDCLPEYDAYGDLVDRPECDPEFYTLVPPCGWPAVLVDGERWLEETPGSQWDDGDSALSVYWSEALSRWVIGEVGQDPTANGPTDYSAGVPYGSYTDIVTAVIYEVVQDPYGQCVQVCSRLQERRIGREFPFNCLEWRWFDESYNDPYSGDLVLRRGWRHIDPRDDRVETLWLEEDDERRCRVRPDGTEPAFGTALISVDGGCSCALNVLVIATGIASARFRCGFCQRWEYSCGTCRCLPAELCVMFYDGETFFPNITLVWDAVELRWGDEYDLLQLTIVGDTARGCTIVPVLPFDWNPPALFPIHDCSNEFTFEGKRIQSGPYLLNVGIEGSRQLYDGEAPVSISASSLVPWCDSGPCGYLPCTDYCGSNPQSVTATVEVYFYDLEYEEVSGGGEGDAYVDPYTDGYCSFSLTLYYRQEVMSIGVDGVEISCSYEGWYTPGGTDCPVLHMSYGAGTITLEWLPDSDGYAPQTIAVDVEQCDPFYASTDERPPLDIVGGYWQGENWPPFFDGTDLSPVVCLGCPTNRFGLIYRVVITE